MDDELQKSGEPSILPAIRVAPLGELRVYLISEDELNELENGSPAAISLNFSLAILASGLSFLAILLTTEIASTKTFTVVVVLTVVFLLVGSYLFAQWYRPHRASTSLAQRIRDRMPAAPGIPEV
jgi:hypothetical protein